MTPRFPTGPSGRTVLSSLVLLLALPLPARTQTLTLAEALDSAFATHPSVAGARARVDGAQAGVAAARAQWLPSLTGTAGLTRFQEPMVVAPLHGFDPRNPPAFDRTLVQTQLGMQYTLFDGGGRGARIRAADAVEGEALARQRGTRMALLEGVTSAYLATLAATDVLDAATRQVTALASEHERAQKNLAEGSAARVEVLRANAALMDARAREATAVSQARIARNDLARMMGLDPSALEGRTLADVELHRTPTSPAESESPEIVQARRAVDAARARQAQAKASRLPDLQAAAGLLDYGTASGDFVTEWQAGVKVSWPLFTGGARRARIHQAAADLRSARAALDLVRLEHTRALDQARAAVVEADARRQALDASVQQWEEVARIEVLSLAEGSGVQTDLLQAQAGLFQARAGYARARYDAVLARVKLARTQGTLDRKWIDEALEVR